MDQAQPASRGSSRGRFALLFVLLYGCALVPLFLCDPLPLNDLPNHVARMHILAHYDSAPALQRHYAIDWQALPNLAMDVLVPPLARVTSAETASWLFVALTLLLLASGAAALHAALFRRLTPYPLCAFLLLYNREVLWGFVNFAFATGLSLWALAGWIWLRDRPARMRIPLSMVLGILLYFAHIHAFCCYAVLLGGYELSRAWPGWRTRPWQTARTLLGAGTSLSAPLLLFVFASPTGALAGELSYGSAWNKLSRLLAPFNNYQPVLDVVTFLLCAGLLGYGLLGGRLTLHRHMRLALGGLALLFVVLPQQLFDAWSVDRRVLLALSLALVGSTELRRVSRPRMRQLALLLLALFVLRTAVVARHWLRADAIYAQHVELLDRVEHGSRLAAIVVGPERPHLQDPPLWELANVAVSRRHVYTNAIFAEKGHHILRVRNKPGPQFYRSPSQKLIAPTSAACDQLERNPYRDMPLREFDFLYLVNEQLIAHRRPEWLHPVDRRANATLYRIDASRPKWSHDPIDQSGEQPVR